MEWKECLHEVEDLRMLMYEMEWKEECVWYMEGLDLDQEGDYEMDQEGWMDLEGWRNDGMKKCLDLEEKRNLQCHALEEDLEMELGV